MTSKYVGPLWGQRQGPSATPGPRWVPLRTVRWAVLLVLLVAQSGLGDVLEKSAQLGPVQTSVSLDSDQPLIGDTVTLKLTVVAEPDVELLLPEFGEALDRFTILDFVPRRDLSSDGQTIATQTYRLQPTLSGEQSIPPILVEFIDRRPGKPNSPDDQDAYEILTPRIDFVVQSVVPDNASSELKPPLGPLQPLGRSPVQRWSWLLITSICGLAVLPFVWRYWQQRRAEARRRSAYDIARARLNRLNSQPLPQEQDVDPFFVELSAIVRCYLEDRFELRAPDLTTEEFLDSVTGSPDLTRDHQTLLSDFLKQADQVKFAGVRPQDQDIRQALAAASRFLEETREDAPLIDETDVGPRPSIAPPLAEERARV